MVAARRQALPQRSNNNEVDAQCSNSVETQWRPIFKNAVQSIVEPDETDWMDDDGSLSDAQYFSRALPEFESRYTRPLYNPAPAAREALAAKMGSLPCIFVHVNDIECSLSNNRPSIDAISPFIAGALPLLSGPTEEVTPKVRMAVFDALCKTLRHHTSGFSGGKLENIEDMVIRAMKDKDRSVRLSAGHSLVELVRLHQILGGSPWKRTERLFGMIYRLFETAEPRARETTLITLGWVGHIATSNVLGQTICCLLAQFGQQNPILRGTAHLQLQALSKHLKKSPYGLISPYMDQIAPFLVSRICTQPTLLHETCSFLAMPVGKFILGSLSRTLPQVYINCDARALDAISREVNDKTAKLFMNFSHNILAYVFCLTGPGQTNKVLNFILSVLKNSAQQKVDLALVIRSCVVPLVAEIVLGLGDDDPDRARQGLKKVERAAQQSRSCAQVDSGSKIGAFMRTYMLGVISHLNDLLQDGYGRRSLETKKNIVRSLGQFTTEVGPTISRVAPQIMATLQTTLVIPQLSDVTLDSWFIFLRTLEVHDLGLQVGPTSAALVTHWNSFSLHGREIAKRCLEFIVVDMGGQLGSQLDEVVDLESIPQLTAIQQSLLALRQDWNTRDKLQKTLERATSESLTVATQALCELKAFLLSNDEEFVRSLASGDVFDPAVNHILSTLFSVAGRDGEGTEPLRLRAFECIGILGAVDPDRIEFGVNDSRMIMLSNFVDDSESVSFALHLIQDIMVNAFRSTSDITYQTHLAYALQELLRFCKFTETLVNPSSTSSISLKVRSRWNSLPKHVLETIIPLLSSKYTLDPRDPVSIQHPIYPTQDTYREWIQTWAGHLITRVSGANAKAIFQVFSAVIRNKDVTVAHHLLPHLALNVLISGNNDDADGIRSELLAVLSDQIASDSRSTSDKKLLSAQTVFLLLDHFSQWVRVIRQDLGSGKGDTRRGRVSSVHADAEEQVLRLDSILSSIDLDLMARAALQCKAYARSLMSFERQVLDLQARDAKQEEIEQYHERLHEIYAHLDEPDGMEGVSTLILCPSLQHQIRQHESTGRWTSAQSCWEVRLQQSPDNPEFHLGLLRCLRNLGHYDTLRTHVKGVLTRNPAWASLLVGLQVEGEWMVGNWDEVKALVSSTVSNTAPVLLAQVLLALREGNISAINETLSNARRHLGAPIAAVGTNGYRRSYESVLNLHLLHELEVIHERVLSLPSNLQDGPGRRQVLSGLTQRLAARLDSTLPSFRVREPILATRRVAFALSPDAQSMDAAIGQSWLTSAKTARKAGYWQTAYSAVLQARQYQIKFSFVESAKLVKASGEPLRALQELESNMRLNGILPVENTITNLTRDQKAHVLRARWMADSDRFEAGNIAKILQRGADMAARWESGQFHFGRYHDECFATLSPRDKMERGLRMNLVTVRAYAKAMRYGSKYIYQTVPRLLTLWLDMGESTNPHASDVFKKINAEVSRSIATVPAYKWYTAFPQIVSRVGHSNNEVYEVLSGLILTVIKEYPRQALWLFTAVVKSTKSQRAQRGDIIMRKLEVGIWISTKITRTLTRPLQAQGGIVAKLVKDSRKMTEALLALCDRPLRDDVRVLSLKKDCPSLERLAPSRLIIPLQESLIATLPPSSAADATHQPFPVDAPTFAKIFDEVEIMRSLAKPRKVTIQGSDGQIYMFLGKPKDDLRKDARLMEFNAIINKLLKSNSESRRRQLHIRTYGVVTLNEECGFIQWVPNTIPFRPVVVKGYDRRSIRWWVAQHFHECVLKNYPPVFHEWFIETFPEPTAWLASRLAYSRTAAVMSMVGFILGLGDRHCENILLDTNNGDVVHVDFNCLFEKGKTLETPERVPFRLTQNVVDGFGVTGVEGVFRIACEVTMQLLRDNKDALMSVLDTFVHDPLVEWEDEKRKKIDVRGNPANPATIDLRTLAKDALKPIDKKLRGIYTTSRERPERETSTSSLVQMLIQESTDLANLGRMYPGWSSWL
ncbi:hypothetical protein POSPLADRAFT_1048687 [Postia placenta MAD-698-R-SB12]|uniref:non-specific serine/threonine protein kinase n=1 Tax=Postia placenta MAD-698-R-SB12 TaxID=670580 RepID=A0A1X6MSR1_9APHY|nr:hypothetical protein POSPLADRAFT_1048687 [Postia placenta MAD-698-R-SB12]OSX59349.1 hypothetical protein POSPLADRAFT_1048687 [Postia placenta MAD-698-R-SB12]